VSFGIDRRARSTKGKGLFRRSADPKEVGERLGWLLRRSEKLGMRRAGWANDAWTAEVEFHELASPVKLAIDRDAELRVRAQTVALGPGYHAHVLARLAPILSELEYAWADASDAPADPTRAMCEWLAAQLAAAGDDQIRIGVPSDRAFICDAPVLTALGPRDAAWRDAAIADPMKCCDAFPWVEAKPGRAALARALLKMWHEVAWREPIDNAEQALLEAIDGDLVAVRKADPKAPIPYAEWAELLHWMNADPERVAKHRELANGQTRGTIGYRRLDMDVELLGGWVVQLPGAFTGRYEDDGARFWSTDGDRTIEFQSLTAGDSTDSAALLAIAPERHPVIDRFSDGSRIGRAEAHTEDRTRVVHGLVVVAPEVAVLTCKGSLADEAWALATWRSLRRG
jgi:hypothetical protein